ncbi:MAG: hypothetical protein E7551_09715 [Ruminococcaceae bacterium]|nr:hypothetical protein [Oscillospiraceae bacterium]
MSKLSKYWIITLLSTLTVCSYPVYMGFRVIYDMFCFGSVPKENFPKYVIPYTPIAVCVIVAVAIMPFIFKILSRFQSLAVTVFALAIFFVTELLLESQILVDSGATETQLQNWQMLSCYKPPELFETRKWTAVDVLIGDYNPAFKLHFYLISVILIMAIINVIYGFAKIIKTGDKTRLKSNIIQAVCVILFLGLCILACFTAFFRDGELTVSPISAFLMCLFFVVMGVTAGLYAGSFLLERGKIALVIPPIIAFVITLLMYIGEMILLSGNLYILGEGFLFKPIGKIVLSAFDIMIILLSTGITVYLGCILNRRKKVKT